MLYNQGNGAIGTISKTGAMVRWGAMEADANHYWAEYITSDGPYVFTTTFVFESYELYEEVAGSILSGEMIGIMGYPTCIEEGNHGYVHDLTNLYVDWFVVNE